MMLTTSGSAGILPITHTLLRKDGLRGLYRGFTISLVMQAPAVGTFLTTYERSKSYLVTHTRLSADSPLVHLAAGLTAESVSAVFWVPMEVIKQRAQARTGLLQSARASVIVSEMLLHEGVRSFFKGYALTIGVFGPYSMLYFMAYERLKQLFTPENDTTGGFHGGGIALCAAGAGAAAAAITSPLDVIKTRLQTQGDAVVSASLSTSVSRTPNRYRGTCHVARSIVREEGLRGLFRGMSARVLWIIPGTSITMSMFEYLKSRFHLTE